MASFVDTWEWDDNTPCFSYARIAVTAVKDSFFFPAWRGGAQIEKG